MTDANEATASPPEDSTAHKAENAMLQEKARILGMRSIEIRSGYNWWQHSNQHVPTDPLGEEIRNVAKTIRETCGEQDSTVAKLDELVSAVKDMNTTIDNISSNLDSIAESMASVAASLAQQKKRKSSTTRDVDDN